MHGLKVFETRTWTTTYRGSLLIHAARKCDLGNIRLANHPDIAHHLQEYNYAGFDELPRGAILGQVELMDIFHVAALFNDVDLHRRYRDVLNGVELQAGHWSTANYGWLLRVTDHFRRYIRTPGKLGLWDFTIEYPLAPQVEPIPASLSPPIGNDHFLEEQVCSSSKTSLPVPTGAESYPAPATATISATPSAAAAVSPVAKIPRPFSAPSAAARCI
jgi:hypothetical protein